MIQKLFFFFPACYGMKLHSGCKLMSVWHSDTSVMIKYVNSLLYLLLYEQTTSAEYHTVSYASSSINCFLLSPLAAV